MLNRYMCLNTRRDGRRDLANNQPCWERGAGKHRGPGPTSLRLSASDLVGSDPSFPIVLSGLSLHSVAWRYSAQTVDVEWIAGFEWRSVTTRTVVARSYRSATERVGSHRKNLTE